MEIFGYLASVLIGILLGLIGGGGSILTVPVMVYLFGLQPLLATSYSLFIVGITSLTGGVYQFRSGQVHVKAAVFIGIASTLTVYLTRKFLLPLIPETLIDTGGFTLTSSTLTMVLFAFLMLLSSVSMIHNRPDSTPLKECSDCVKFIKLAGYGISIGLITGFLGAGGGFLLIPALVLVIRLPVKKAVGTSLAIIAINSLSGFAGDLGNMEIDWQLLIIVTTAAITGIFIGNFISRKISGENLRIVFGWFVLLVGIFILIDELFLQHI